MAERYGIKWGAIGNKLGNTLELRNILGTYLGILWEEMAWFCTCYVPSIMPLPLPKAKNDKKNIGIKERKTLNYNEHKNS